MFAEEWVEPVAHVLARLNSNHVLVVHSDDGMDEISIGAPTSVAELREGSVSTYKIAPSDFGIAEAPLSSVVVSNVEESEAVVRAVLDNEPGPARDIVLLNAGANPTLEDDLYHGTPAGWARNRGHTALAECLQTLA